MKTAFASLVTLSCLALGCSDGSEGQGNPFSGGTAGSAGAGGARPTGGVSSGGSSSGAPSTAGAASGGSSAGSGGAPVPTDGPGLYGFHCAVCHGEQGRGS